MYFTYGEKEITYLKEKDPILGVCIEKIGMIEREVDADLFSSVVHHIVGQQISTKAQATIWKRIQNELGTSDAEHVVSAGIEKLQSLGIFFRKAGYIMDFAQKVKNGEFDLEGLWEISDEEAIRQLSSVNCPPSTFAYAKKWGLPASPTTACISSSRYTGLTRCPQA